MSRAGARWLVVAAAVVAGAAGVAAVVTAAALPAIVAGVASALVAVLALIDDPEDAAAEEQQQAIVPAAPTPEAQDGVEDPDIDPLRELFESGPPAGRSGMLAAAFVHTTLRGRMAIARRELRPLSLVCFEVHETRAGGHTGAPVPTEVVAAIVRRTLRDTDISGHLDEHTYVSILADTGEDGAVWTAERIRRNLTEGGQPRRFRAGVAAYPAHGLEPEELEAKATAALEAARDWATDRIEVAGSS